MITHLVYERETGLHFPDGMEILHACDNPSCVRWDHLRLGTQTDNMIDKARKGRGAQKLNPIAAAQIRQLVADGAMLSDVARQYGVTDVCISNVVRGNIWKYAAGPINRNLSHWTVRHPERTAKGAANGAILHPETLKRGEDNPASKLTEEKVREIRRRVEAGETKRAIGRDLGVTDVLVGMVARRKIWRHVA
jgi:DNA invertase Pin-like site-specific DNA recombinase